MFGGDPVMEKEGVAGVAGRFEAVEGAGVVDEQDLTGHEVDAIRRVLAQLRGERVEILVGAFAPEPRREEQPVFHPEGFTRDRAALGIAVELRGEAHGSLAQRFLRVLGETEKCRQGVLQQDGAAARGFA